jgi:predicted SnoaL-like aldol condensation-catalyzing enzyme
VSAQENEALVRWFFEEAWGNDNLAAVDEYIVVDYVEHTLPPGSQQGREALKQFVAMYHEAFPDVKVTIHDIPVLPVVETKPLIPITPCHEFSI